MSVPEKKALLENKKSKQGEVQSTNLKKDPSRLLTQGEKKRKIMEEAQIFSSCVSPMGSDLHHLGQRHENVAQIKTKIKRNEKITCKAETKK